MNDAMRFLDCPVAALDVETTGFDPKSDRIIEIAVIHMQGGVVTERFASLVNPEREVPEEVQKLTGISPEELATAPRFAEIAEEVRRRLEGRIFLAYNHAFDRAFVAEELGRVGMSLPVDRFADPLVFVRQLQRHAGSKRLTAVAERLNIPLAAAHRAADDAEAAGLVLYALLPQLPEFVDDLLMLQEQWETQQRHEMAGWRGGRGETIETPMGEPRARGDALGPAYLYGDDTDPVRAMFRQLPDSGGAVRRG